MTVLDKKAASGIESKGIGKYVGVALVAGTIGVVGALGFTNLTDDSLSPAQIEQVRGDALADHQLSLWLGRIEAARQADQIARFEGPFMAQVARINQQRAEGMVEHFENQNKARAAAIAEQRGQDMVEFKYGWGR